LSFDKAPSDSLLPEYWLDNIDALLAYIEPVYTMGFSGTVIDAVTKAPLQANITVDSNPIVVRSDPANGAYYRLVLPGTHTVTVSANGYAPQTQVVTVNAGVQTRVGFSLTAGSAHHSTSTTHHSTDTSTCPDSTGAVIPAFIITLSIVVMAMAGSNFYFYQKFQKAKKRMGTYDTVQLL